MVVPFTARRVDDLLREREELELRITDQEEQLRALTQNLKAQQQRVVKRCTVTVTGADEVDRLLLEREAKELLATVPGVPVDAVDGQLLLNLLNGRTATVNRKRYVLTVKLVVVAETVEVFLTARREP
jgi:hypothetical protein